MGVTFVTLHPLLDAVYCHISVGFLLFYLFY